MIELPIRRLRDDAVLPERAYAGDAGLDLAACERHELGPGERAAGLRHLVTKAVTAPKPDKWRSENPGEIERILPMIEPTMRKLGYEVGDQALQPGESREA